MQQSLKIVLGISLAIFTAEIIGLKYSPTAGIICLVSIYNTRKQTYTISLKRFISALFAIILAYGIFHIAGHNLGALTVFLLIFLPLSTCFNASEAIVVGTVLVSHIYSINSLGVDILLNDNRYYIRYFQMRRQQYQILYHIDGYLKSLSVPVNEAIKLSRFTRSLAYKLDEYNNGKEMMEKAKELESHYKKTSLPETREEFENRANSALFLLLHFP